ncbi:hypothetical protein LIER_30997 [Lithospermum erythrorhizon]|uniref:Uncharacterized protein n=1 Tax=Lithospermum erythrorhizon TaxID=34254 RepID=A0AAV3RT79_LITER
MVPVRHFSRTVNPTVKSNKVDFSENDQDDEVVVVAGRRRTRASIAALEEKRTAFNVGRDRGESAEPMDLEDLELLIEKKKAVEKRKSKRPCSRKSKEGVVPKKRKGVVISEPSHGRAKDNFIVDDVKEKRVVDVEVEDAGQSAVVPEEEAAVLLIKAYEKELKILEVDIRLKQNRVAELKAKIQALQTTVPPTVNDPTSDVAEDPDETTQSHV